MTIPPILTERCVLRAPSREDAGWMYELFNVKDVVRFINGISWYNSDVKSVGDFIDDMLDKASKSKALIWNVTNNEVRIGVCFVLELTECPFISFAVFPNHRDKGYGREVVNAVLSFIKTQNGSNKAQMADTTVKKEISRHHNVLYLGSAYCESLNELEALFSGVDVSKSAGRALTSSLVGAFRDGTLTEWLLFLSENGVGEALDLMYTISGISDEAGDRYVEARLLAALGVDTPQTSEKLLENINLLDKCNIVAGDKTYEGNPFEPISLPEAYENISLTIHFEVKTPCHDKLTVSVGDAVAQINLEKKRKKIPVRFDLKLADRFDEDLQIRIDNSPYHTVRLRYYPPADWDYQKCISQGVRHLYMQQYDKARLCFERHVGSASLFWLGIMHYIGAFGPVQIDRVIQCFRAVSASEYEEFVAVNNRYGTLIKRDLNYIRDVLRRFFPDREWTLVANCMLALLALKGEGLKHDRSEALKQISQHTSEVNGVRLVRNAIRGNLSSIVYDKLIYSYNLKDKTLTPYTTMVIKGYTAGNVWLVAPKRPIGIRLVNAFNPKLSEIDPVNDSLHIHLGVKTKNGEWQYVLDDWTDNNPQNTFAYDPQNQCWSLTIDNLYETYKIQEHEEVLQINFVLRNSDGTVEIKPEDGTHYIIDCQTNRTHIALLNLSALLVEFSLIKGVLDKENIGIHRSFDLSDAQAGKLTISEWWTL